MDCYWHFLLSESGHFFREMAKTAGNKTLYQFGEADVDVRVLEDVLMLDRRSDFVGKAASANVPLLRAGDRCFDAGCSGKPGFDCKLCPKDAPVCCRT